MVLFLSGIECFALANEANADIGESKASQVALFVIDPPLALYYQKSERMPWH